MPQLPKRFNSKYALKEESLSRARKFDPQNLFLSVLHLAASKGEGYWQALARTWEKSGLKISTTPAKSSLSEYRSKVSFKFFEDIFNKDLEFNRGGRRTFRNHYIYAVDGNHLDAPPSEDLLQKGYRGYPHRTGRETHYVKMYTVHAVDLTNEAVIQFRQSSQIGELRLAHQLPSCFEKNSITLYDRNYDNYATAIEHIKAGNYFFIRVKAQNPNSQSQIAEFKKSLARSKNIELRPPKLWKEDFKPNISLRLTKIRNPKSGEDLIFMTNIPHGLIQNKEAAGFYLKRWGIESSFKDLTDTLKLGDWHAKTLNGMLQELYALLWLVNVAKRFCLTRIKTKDWLARQYERANFKLIVTLFVEHLQLAIEDKNRKLQRLLSYWLERSTEKRTHLARSYPRARRRKGRDYLCIASIPSRA